MHDRRNFALILFLGVGVIWTGLAWLIQDPATAPMSVLQRTGSLILLLGCGAWLVHAMLFEEKLPDYLKEAVGDIYYEVDGLCFMPIVRMHEGQPELCVYYQNRYDSPVHAIVHLRPEAGTFEIHPGASDVHFAFTANGGDFGVIHQPILIPDRVRGDVVDVKVAAASYYPRSHGATLRRHEGIPCGSVLVDWGGAAFRVGVHEVSGEIELHAPATIHLAMPKAPVEVTRSIPTWRQEQLHAGMA
ncbi:MAG: hypothetical protein ACYTGR_11025 [Planctomycetota bacterium]|jgi:hypothetical protein